MLCIFQNLLSVAFQNPYLNYAVLRSEVVQKHFASSQIGIHINKGCQSSQAEVSGLMLLLFVRCIQALLSCCSLLPILGHFCIVISHFTLAGNRISLPSTSLRATRCLWAVPNLGVSLEICHCLYDRLQHVSPVLILNTDIFPARSFLLSQTLLALASSNLRGIQS